MNAPAAGAESLPAWDLEAIYASPADWEADFSHIRPLAEAFAAYRGRLAESPETLAAAMVDIAIVKADSRAFDPMCGSGTILIEAAMKAKNIARYAIRVRVERVSS